MCVVHLYCYDASIIVHGYTAHYTAAHFILVNSALFFFFLTLKISREEEVRVSVFIITQSIIITHISHIYKYVRAVVSSYP